MKYLKYYLSALLILIVILVSGGKGVKAFSSNLDFGALSPRFQYLLDEDDVIIPFEFELFEVYDYPSLAEDNDYNLRLIQVNYDGSYVKQLATYRPDFEIVGSTITTTSLDQTAISSDTEDEFIVLYDLPFMAITSVEVNSVTLISDAYEVLYDSDIHQYTIRILFNSSNTGDTITINYTYETETDYRAELYYGWEGLQFDDNNIAFYQLMIDGIVIWSGAVMLPPQDNYLPYGAYGVEVGEFLVEDGEVASDVGGFTDQTQFTSYEDDRYIILHYRIPEALVYPAYMTFRVTDVINNTLIDAFTTETILQVQGGGTTNFKNAFVVIPIDNTISKGLKIDYPVSYNDSYKLLLSDLYVEGSYYFAIDDAGSLLGGSTVVWNIVSDDKDPFELYLAHYELKLDSRQRANFNKNSLVIVEGYTTIMAKDYDVNISFVEPLNSINISYSVEYYADLDLLEGDTSYFTWRVQPLFLPYTLDVSDFNINMKEVYLYGGERGVASDLADLRTSFGMSDSDGGIAFSILILVVINSLLLFVTRATFIFGITNITVVSVLDFFGFVPMWFIMAVILLAILGVKLTSGGGVDSYE